MPFGNVGYPNQVFPSNLRSEYPGLGGFRDALRGYGNLAYGPESLGFQQLTESSAADEVAGGYGAGMAGIGGPASGGVGQNAAQGLYAQLLGGLGGANVAGQKARDVGQNAALKGMVNTGVDAASSMAGLQAAQAALEKATGQQTGQDMSMFGGLLDAFTSPKGMGANIMQPFMSSGQPTSPFAALLNGTSGTGGIMNIGFGGGGGIESGAGALSGLGSALTASGSGGLTDLMASLGGAGGAGGFSDLFATLLEAAPMAAAA